MARSSGQKRKVNTEHAYPGRIGTNAELLERFQQSLDAGMEIGCGCDEAEDQVTIGREIVEVAWVNQNMVILEKLDSEFLIRGTWWHAKDSVPAGIRAEEFALGLWVEKGLESSTVFANAIEKLRPQGVPLGQQRGKRGLCGSADGKKSVGDDFQTIERGTDERNRAGDGEPCDFHLRQRGDFGKAAKSEGKGFGVGSESFARQAVEGETQEDFVHDQSKIMFLADGVQAEELFGLDVGAGGIVGMDEENGTRAIRN